MSFKYAQSIYKKLVVNWITQNEFVSFKNSVEYYHSTIYRLKYLDYMSECEIINTLNKKEVDKIFINSKYKISQNIISILFNYFNSQRGNYDYIFYKFLEVNQLREGISFQNNNYKCFLNLSMHDIAIITMVLYDHNFELYHILTNDNQYRLVALKYDSAENRLFFLNEIDSDLNNELNNYLSQLAIRFI